MFQILTARRARKAAANGDIFVSNTWHPQDRDRHPLRFFITLQVPLRLLENTDDQYLFITIRFNLIEKPD